MAARCHKLYHEPGFDAREFLDNYFSKTSHMIFGDDFFKFPMEKVYNSLISGHVKGNTLTDISLGSFIHHLYPACGFFKEIIVLRLSDRCMMELNKWRHSRTGAYDWSHTATTIKEVEGESGHHEEKDIKLKEVIKHVVKCDITKEDLTEPLVVPQADCLFSFGLLECISKDEEDYIKNLRKFIKFLKPGGHLLLLGVINASYYTVGKERFRVFTYDENFVKKVLIGESFRIDHCEVLKRKAESNLADYKGLVFVKAQKE